ncbi:TIGR00296 family protein [Desulfurococcus mucosus]|uniref:Protein Desmu_0173 n=1 Tax=Desulfurococcus mucosus (strain ATCC 35584 / DSM 2162 / JCM 9187 / O7/1) TaxID=765177 RepID=E8R7J7_DESM0|nr:TIGR00296 family protein [Desulfurococcus mucosus]ADV64492.1 AMMECR1 domain protein [Desulfurococcus mucosus DSM 2162]
MNPVHPSELTLEEGSLLVKIARDAIEAYVTRGERIDVSMYRLGEKLLRPGMTFTTIERLDESGRPHLRGCIGFLAPLQSLVESTVESAIEAAVNDPRFNPVEPWELDKLIIEVTVLSQPSIVDVGDRWVLPSLIIIGRHGLVAEKGWFKGTLLPVVPVEYCWDEETFLAETCVKAGLRPDCWLDKSTKIHLYEGRVFREREPRGEVYERDMNKEYRSLCSRKT